MKSAPRWTTEQLTAEVRKAREAFREERLREREFGTRLIVPVAVLSGVFKVHNLEQAQTGGLTLFWAHKLDDMRAFIEATRP